MRKWSFALFRWSRDDLGRLPSPEQYLEMLAGAAAGRYVFHGSSGSSRVNLDSETQYAFTRAAAEHMIDHREGLVAAEPASGDKRAYDPRA